WPVNGFVVCNAAGDQTDISAMSDGQGGFWACWLDNRSGIPKNYATRVLPNATIAPGFAANGVLLDSTRPNAQHPASITDDGQNDLVAVWEYEFSPADHDVYAALLKSNSTLSWSVGLAVTATSETFPACTTESGVFDLVWRFGSNTIDIGRYSYANGANIT